MPLSDLEINTLGTIRDALKQITVAQSTTKPSPELDDEYNNLYQCLDNIQSLLIDKHIEKYLADIEDGAKELQQITKGIQKDINKIRKLSGAINKAADAIKVIIETAKAAVSVGIL